MPYVIVEKHPTTLKLRVRSWLGLDIVEAGDALVGLRPGEDLAWVPSGTRVGDDVPDANLLTPDELDALRELAGISSGPGAASEAGGCSGFDSRPGPSSENDDASPTMRGGDA